MPSAAKDSVLAFRLALLPEYSAIAPVVKSAETCAMAGEAAIAANTAKALKIKRNMALPYSKKLPPVLNVVAKALPLNNY